ncbi:MAG TPA: hypothetical protein VLB73_00290 [Patescibacteria group bacterium]|nr:hypothetical protein [Patescibacteria group bacterium]
MSETFGQNGRSSVRVVASGLPRQSHDIVVTPSTIGISEETAEVLRQQGEQRLADRLAEQRRQEEVERQHAEEIKGLQAQVADLQRWPDAHALARQMEANSGARQTDPTDSISTWHLEHDKGLETAREHGLRRVPSADATKGNGNGDGNGRRRWLRRK